MDGLILFYVVCFQTVSVCKFDASSRDMSRQDSFCFLWVPKCPNPNSSTFLADFKETHQWPAWHLMRRNVWGTWWDRRRLAMAGSFFFFGTIVVIKFWITSDNVSFGSLYDISLLRWQISSTLRYQEVDTWDVYETMLHNALLFVLLFCDG